LKTAILRRAENGLLTRKTAKNIRKIKLRQKPDFPPKMLLQKKRKNMLEQISKITTANYQANLIIRQLTKKAAIGSDNFWKNALRNSAIMKILWSQKKGF
jgi:hypothetical protein